MLVLLLSPPIFAHAALAQQPATNAEALLETARQMIEKEGATLPELQQAASLLERAQKRLSNEIRIPIYLARAYYRMADPEKDIDEEYVYYRRVETYAKRAIQMNPNRAEGHYWYGLFLLKKAQKTGGLRAFFIVRDGIRELELVRKTMPEYDHGGASRVLGLLSCRAPAWTPFGNVDRCVQLAEESIRIAPDHLQNRLYLANAYRRRGDKEAAIHQYRTILAEASTLPEEQRDEWSREAMSRLESLERPGDKGENIPHNSFSAAPSPSH